MAANSDGTLTAVVICEGNLHDPDFPKKFRTLLGKLKTILQQPKSKKLKVNKVEPWNSVRVTLSIPKDAAARLRQLAAEGNSALRALGILSVQLEGDTVISLRLAGQEIVLRTDNDSAGCAQDTTEISSGFNDLSSILTNPMQSASASCSMSVANSSNVNESIPGPSSRIISQPPPITAVIANSITNSSALDGPSSLNKAPIFKSPNTVCPMDGKLPVPPPVVNVTETREYPFESMTQARVIHRRENTMAVVAALGVNQSSSLTSPQTSLLSSTSTAQKVVVGSNQAGVIETNSQLNQTSLQPPPPLAIPVKPLLVSTQQKSPLPQEQTIKSQQFIQPPPPPYPSTATASATIKSLPIHHQANTIPLPTNTSLSNNNANNIAISSPLLVNLLQNDATGGHVKHYQSTTDVATQQQTAHTSGVLISQQSTGQTSRVLHQTIGPTLKSNISNQQTELMINSPNMSHRQQKSPVEGNLVYQNGQIIVNNGGSVINPSNSNNTNISNLNPLNPVPSSHAISIRTPQSTLHHQNQSPTHHHNVTSAVNVSALTTGNVSQTTVNSQILMGKINPTQQSQQQELPLQAQQQLLLRQQQIIQAAGDKPPQIQRFSLQNSTPPSPSPHTPQSSQIPQQIMNSPTTSSQQHQQQFRPSIQQHHQQYVVPPSSPHQNISVTNHSSMTTVQQSSVLNQKQQTAQLQQGIGGMQHQQHQQQNMDVSCNSRWPFKPMDSATKSSFQEFTRYQMQYNLQQQQLNQAASTSNMGTLGNVTAVTKSSIVSDPLSLGLADLDELTKNDLDSLLPNLNVGDLDSALGLDCKNTLESLLDANNLDLDLIDQDLPPTTTSILDAVVSLEEHQVNQENNNNNSSNSNINSSNSNLTGACTEVDTAANNNNNNNSNNKTPSLTNTGKQRQYLINPLTGDLEPVPSEESESESEMGGANMIMDGFNEFQSEISNSLFSDDDENSCSTASFSKTSDHSDTERSTNSETSGRSRYSKNRRDKKDSGGGHVLGNSKKSKLSMKNALLKEKLQQGIREKFSGGKSRQTKERTTKAKLISTITSGKNGKDSSPAEKIKLRLKLEKSEPITPAYKIDVSFVQSPKRVQSVTAINCVNTSSNSSSNNVFSPSSMSTSITSSSLSSPNTTVTQESHQHTFNSTQHQLHLTSQSQQQSLAGEELRVPPLHISLRGKNSIVIKNSKKDRKKSQGGEDDEMISTRKSQIKKNHNLVDEATTGISISSGKQHDDHSSPLSSPIITIKNNHHHHSNLINKIINQGKPSARQSNDEYSNTTKVFHSTTKQIVENGGEIYDNSNVGENKLNLTTMVTSKRNMSDVIQSLNGLISSETKRRRISQATTSTSTSNVVVDHQQSQSQKEKNKMNEFEKPYSHLKGGPIGSTNIGTLPQHVTSSKSQKSDNGNLTGSSSNYNTKNKNLMKSSKAALKSSKSSVKDPGKSPPMNKIVTESNLSSSSSSSLSIALKSTTVTKSTFGLPEFVSNNNSNSSNSTKEQSTSVTSVKSSLLTQQQPKQSNIPNETNESKLKQKLLELQDSDKLNKLDSPLCINQVNDLAFPDEIFSSPVSEDMKTLSCKNSSNLTNVISTSVEISSNTLSNPILCDDSINASNSITIKKNKNLKDDENNMKDKSKDIDKLEMTITSKKENLSSILSSPCNDGVKRSEKLENQIEMNDSSDVVTPLSSTPVDVSRILSNNSNNNNNNNNNNINNSSSNNEVETVVPSTINTLTNNGNIGVNVAGNVGNVVNVRGSPGSQAQGEDSGIESMDALSEKSPNQSASPQQSDMSHQHHQKQQQQQIINQLGTVHHHNNNKDKDGDCKIHDDILSSSLKSKDILIDDISDIEAALAKMEGINDHFLMPCDGSPDSDQKFNGDLSSTEKEDECLLRNLTDDKTIMCTSPTILTAKIEQVDEDLAQIMMMGDDSVRKQEDEEEEKLEKHKTTNEKSKRILSGEDLNTNDYKDMNENQEIKTSFLLETKFNEECCKNNSKSNNQITVVVEQDSKTVLNKTENISEQKQDQNQTTATKTAKNSGSTGSSDNIIVVKNEEKDTKLTEIVRKSYNIKEESKDFPLTESAGTDCDNVVAGNVEVVTEKSNNIVSNNKGSSNSSNDNEILTPISIEIPALSDDTPRIRTRASSKLESPLDVTAYKQSPCNNQSDSIVTPSAVTNTVKSNLRISTLSVGDKLSPKTIAIVATNTSSISSSSTTTTSSTVTSTTCTTTTTATTTVSTVTSTSVINTNKSTVSSGTKRKRQSSESSSQSLSNDDTLVKGGNNNNNNKRSRQNNNIEGSNPTTTTLSSSITTTTRSSKTLNKKDAITFSENSSVNKSSNVNNNNNNNNNSSNNNNNNNNNNQKQRKNEESSDSDEPLIEVAGKVRSSKYTLKSGHTIQSADTVEKILRNHRNVSQTKNSAFVSINSGMTATTTSTNTSCLVISTVTTTIATATSSAIKTSSKNTTNSVTTTQPTNITTSNSSTPTNVNHQQPTTTSTSNTHLTRASIAVVSSGNGGGSGQNMGQNFSSSTAATEDKIIGTRRSVRASAAANKMIYSRNTLNSENQRQQTSSSLTKLSIPVVDLTVEPRRKTRSTVGVEISAVEGRRRRGSRESK